MLNAYCTPKYVSGAQNKRDVFPLSHILPLLIPCVSSSPKWYPMALAISTGGREEYRHGVGGVKRGGRRKGE